MPDLQALSELRLEAFVYREQAKNEGEEVTRRLASEIYAEAGELILRLVEGRDE